MMLPLSPIAGPRRRLFRLEVLWKPEHQISEVGRFVRSCHFPGPSMISFLSPRPPSEAVMGVLHRHLFNRPSYARLGAQALGFLYSSLGQTGGAFLGRSLSEIEGEDAGLVGWGPLSCTTDPDHASMLCAEALWGGWGVRCMELDVAESAVYSLSSTLMGLDGEKLTEEVDLTHAMVESDLLIFPTDIRGVPLPSGTPEYAAGMRALNFITSSGSRDSIFHNRKKKFSRRHWTAIELEFMWWHREPMVLRHAIMMGDVRVRWARELIPSRSQAQESYRQWYQAGAVPRTVVTPAGGSADSYRIRAS